MTRQVWQIGAGDFGRDYSALFLNHDLMFLGPGRHGSYAPGTYEPLVTGSKETAAKVGMVAAFAAKLQPGDVVLLRRGYRVVALGLAADEPHRPGRHGRRRDADVPDSSGYPSRTGMRARVGALNPG